ncbi:uracil-DNA glycosylase family protein [Paraburkholderia tuberum]|uniref:G/U mismatch-specific uracil-DNA glycosylase n=1 Tax=Paraburkholderia tuberum TaxID=157910 RepID=A0A1H1KKB2_9BURK|nr:uracil-DNA glycosylase family protein [Paraburkholderia tuberum]SDR62527.1 G/U mismatch-specific uracil-DNA glycosylase [Paraburkholderia tuberum]
MPSSLLTTDNSTITTVDGREIRTLRDILPERPGLKVLFVAKTPAPKSVAAGHYFQGRQGRMFWNLLKEHGLFKATTPFEDDSLLDHGFGITDIVKVPREYGNEPLRAEYVAGMDRILEQIRVHRPSVIVFVYKGVLDKLLLHRFDIRKKSAYGFNPDLENHFGARVFAFPLPGTPCTTAQAVAAMHELADAVGRRALVGLHA